MKLVAEAAFCPSAQESWYDSFFIVQFSFFPFPWCVRSKEGLFLIVISCFGIVWSFHIRVRLMLEQILLPFHAAQHRGWGSSFSTICMARGCYRLGPVLYLKRSKEMMVTQGSCSTKWENRGSGGNVNMLWIRSFVPSITSKIKL